jgi:leucyl/phenylalanyl-tRNA--protein transferase
MSAIPWLQQDSLDFPPVAQALSEPDGLLAVGGDLQPSRLIEAYRRGIFPWYEDHQPILWWSPDPRMVLYPEKLHVSRSLARLLKQERYQVSFDTDFAAVISRCAAQRQGQEGTWITPAMQAAYERLHHLGYAHSVEVWEQDTLIGGLYGIAIGRLFFGESMFSARSNASKVGFVHLVRQLQRWEFHLVDCQLHSEHLQSLGAEPVSRQAFQDALDTYLDQAAPPSPWQTDAGLITKRDTA